MIRIVYTLLLIFFSAHTVCAQRIISEQELDSIKNPKLLPEGELVLVCDHKEQNIGTLSEDGAPSSRRFVLRNISSKPVTLTKQVTSCGCTVAKSEVQTIAPNKEGEITLTFHPYGQVGRINNRALIYTNLSDSYPTLCLTITGTVKPSSDPWRDYPHAMEDLRLRYTTVYFSEVPQALSPSERIECGNSGNNPMKLSVLKGSLPSYLKFRTEPEIIPAGGIGEIVITVIGKLLPRDKDQVRFPLIIDGLDIPAAQRTLNVKIDTTSRIRD